MGEGHVRVLGKSLRKNLEDNIIDVLIYTKHIES